MKIEAGKLDRRASILRPENVRNGVGEVTRTYSEAGKRWASLLRLLPDELERQQAPGSTAEAKLLVRLDTLTRQIGIRWRVELEGVTYNILGMDATPGDGSLVLYIAGVQDAG